MNIYEFNDVYEKDIKKIKDLKLDKEIEKEILKMFQELEYQYKRLEKYTKLNMDVYEEQKKILLNNFIKKDADTNYLYNELTHYQKTLMYKFYDFLRKIYRKVRPR